VKKIVGLETTIFVYNAGGKLLAEYSTQTASNPTISYLTSDNLGSPRVITDNGGNVSSRRDFLPFGEELNANSTANRTVNSKYSFGEDGVRKRFTGYEKDQETGLDFAEARMYNNQHGRFTAVDPMLASGLSSNPQTFNRYAYVSNNPINATDPSGLNAVYAFSLGVSPMGAGSGDPYSSSPFMQMAEEMVEPLTAPASNGARWVAEGGEVPATSAQQTTPVASQTASVQINCFCSVGRDAYLRGERNITTVNVTVTQLNNPILGKERFIKDGPEELRVYTDLVFNYKVNGVNVVGTAQEDITVLEGPPVVQDKEPKELKSGNNGDLVATAPQNVPVSQAQFDQAVREFNKDFITRQIITITVKPSNGVPFKVSQERTLTNRVPGAQPTAGGRIRGYTFTMNTPVIEGVRNFV
jgi:RHS repeat-associated protein